MKKLGNRNDIDSLPKKLEVSFTAVAISRFRWIHLSIHLRHWGWQILFTPPYQHHKRLIEFHLLKYQFFGQHRTFFTNSSQIVSATKTAMTGSTEIQKMTGRRKCEETRTPSPPHLVLLRHPGHDIDRRRVRFQLSASTKLLNKFIIYYFQQSSFSWDKHWKEEESTFGEKGSIIAVYM